MNLPRPSRAVVVTVAFLSSSNAWAVQEHLQREGFYLHQMAHVFFFVAMLLLIAVLRRSFAFRSLGWRRAMQAAVFFLLWNLAAVTLHVGEEYLAPLSKVVGELSHGPVLAVVYYSLSITENVLLVLGFASLALGIRHLERAPPERPA